MFYFPSDPESNTPIIINKPKNYYYMKLTGKSNQILFLHSKEKQLAQSTKDMSKHNFLSHLPSMIVYENSLFLFDNVSMCLFVVDDFETIQKHINLGSDSFTVERRNLPLSKVLRCPKNKNGEESEGSSEEAVESKCDRIKLDNVKDSFGRFPSIYDGPQPTKPPPTESPHKLTWPIILMTLMGVLVIVVGLCSLCKVMRKLQIRSSFLSSMWSRTFSRSTSFAGKSSVGFGAGRRSSVSDKLLTRSLFDMKKTPAKTPKTGRNEMSTSFPTTSNTFYGRNADLSPPTTTATTGRGGERFPASPSTGISKQFIMKTVTLNEEHLAAQLSPPKQTAEVNAPLGTLRNNDPSKLHKLRTRMQTCLSILCRCIPAPICTASTFSSIQARHIHRQCTDEQSCSQFERLFSVTSGSTASYGHGSKPVRSSQTNKKEKEEEN